MTDAPLHCARGCRRRNHHQATCETPDTFPGRAHVNIQWKGTDICADIHCQCGTYSHVDGYIYGEWICRGCHKGFKLAWTAIAYEVEPNDHMQVTDDEEDD